MPSWRYKYTLAFKVFSTLVLEYFYSIFKLLVAF